MKKRLLLLLCIFILYINFVNATVFSKDIEVKHQGELTITSTSPVKQTGSLTTADNALSFQNNEFLTSNAGHVEYNKATKELSVKSADVLVLKDLDAVQLQDARLRNRVLTMQGAGSVHIKDPILIDLDEIGPSTFWFEGNDLRAMEITFPKKKHYLINNPLTNDKSSGFDVEHMLDSDKDGITDEVEKLRNLNPFSKDTDEDGLDDNTELLKFITDPTEKVSNILSGIKQTFTSDSEILSFLTDKIGSISGEVSELTKSLGLKDNLLRDSDGDGISDLKEKDDYGTDPFKYDSDGDGYGDGYEILHGLDLDKKDSLRSDLINFDICNNCKLRFFGNPGDKFFLDLKDYKGNNIGSKLSIKLTKAEFSVLSYDFNSDSTYKANYLLPLKTTAEFEFKKDTNGYEVLSNEIENKMQLTNFKDEIIKGKQITKIDKEKGFTESIIEDGSYEINIKPSENDKGYLNYKDNTAQSYKISSNNFKLLKSNNKDQFYKSNKKIILIDEENNLILAKGKFSYLRKDIKIKRRSYNTGTGEMLLEIENIKDEFQEIFKSNSELLTTEIKLDDLNLFVDITINNDYSEDLPKIYEAYSKNLLVYENKTGRYGEKSKEKPRFINSLKSDKQGIFNFDNFNDYLIVNFNNLNGTTGVYDSRLNIDFYKRKFPECNKINEENKLFPMLFSISLFFIPFLFRKKKAQASYFIILALIIIILLSVISFYKYDTLGSYFKNLVKKELTAEQKIQKDVDYINSCYKTAFDCSLYTLGLTKDKLNLEESRDFSAKYVKNNVNHCIKKGKINAEFNTPINIQIDFSEKSNIKIEHPFIFKIDEAVRKVKDFSFRNDIRYLYLNSIIMKTNNIIDFDLLSTDIETEVYLENPLKFKLIDKNKFNKFQEKFVMVK